MKRRAAALLTALGLVVAAEAAAESDHGRDAYRKACRMCHDTGLTGAPKRGDAAAWTPRIEKGMDVLHRSVVDGFGAMPPRGNCGARCSEEDLRAALEYLIERSR